MNRWALVAVGVGVCAIAVVAMAPATLIDAGLSSSSQGRVRLADARGTLWSGAGQIEFRNALGHAGVSRGLTWHVAPAALLRGRLVYEVALERSTQPFPVTISASRIEVTNAEVNLPAAALGLGMPKLAPLGLTGDVLIRVASLAVARDGMNGNATLRWSDAGSALTPVSPLGDYEVRLDGEGVTLHAYLRTIEGPLRLDGQGSWKRGTNPDFLATAQVASQHRKELAPLLRLIAVERGEGRFELKLN